MNSPLVGDALAPALDAARQIGLLLESPVLDGEWHRVAVEGKRASNRSGSYCLRELVLRSGRRAVVGALKNWVTGAEVSVALDDRSSFSAEDVAEARVAAQRAAKSAAAEQEKRQAETAERATRIWGGLPRAGGCEYLQRKKVRPWGVRFTRGSLVVPVRDVAGQLWSLQFIAPEGAKKFLTGGAKRGRFCWLTRQDADLAPLPDEPPNLVAVCEGYATGASVYEAVAEGRRRLGVAVAFDAGNLRPVAQAIRARWSTVDVVVVADDDCYGEHPQAFIPRRYANDALMRVVKDLCVLCPEAQVEYVDDNDPRLSDPKHRYNVGLSQAIMAAAAVGGFVLLPPGRRLPEVVNG